MANLDDVDRRDLQDDVRDALFGGLFAAVEHAYAAVHQLNGTLPEHAVGLCKVITDGIEAFGLQQANAGDAADTVPWLRSDSRTLASLGRQPNP